MRGVPLRIELGPRDIKNNNIVVFRRDKLEKEILSIGDNVVTLIEEILNKIKSNMKIKAKEIFNQNIVGVETVKAAKEHIDKHRGIVYFYWCGKEDCGKELEEKVHVDILGVQEEFPEEGRCINCGSNAKYKTLIAKTY